jgi:hypothetical protein
MRVLDSNGTLWVWPRVQANTRAISTENAGRSQHIASVDEECSIKLTNNAAILLSLKGNIKDLAPWNTRA